MCWDSGGKIVVGWWQGGGRVVIGWWQGGGRYTPDIMIFYVSSGVIQTLKTSV